jgi:hypothetical protein
MAAATKPDNPATVNPAAANNTVVATADASKHSRLEHGTPANATANNTTEPNPPAAIGVVHTYVDQKLVKSNKITSFNLCPKHRVQTLF